jgi:hypothetical protein
MYALIKSRYGGDQVDVVVLRVGEGPAPGRMLLHEPSSGGESGLDPVLDLILGYGDFQPDPVALPAPFLVGRIHLLEEERRVEPARVGDVSEEGMRVSVVPEECEPEATDGGNVDRVDPELDEPQAARICREPEVARG